MHSKVKLARIAGLLYLLIIIFGLIAQVFVRDNLVDYDNATNTAKNILASLKENHRQIYIVYVNPLHKEIFQSAGFNEEYYLKKMTYIELSILSNVVNVTE